MIDKETGKEFIPTGYLGFGVLDTETLVSTDKGFIASYTAGGDPVYDVRCSETECEIDEFFHEKIIASASGENPRQAFFNLFKQMDPLTHPRFSALVAEIIRSGNIYFLYPDMKSGYLFYPGGFLFCLTQPIGKPNRAAWQRVKRAIETDLTGAMPVVIFGLNPGAIFRQRENGEVESEDVEIVHLATTLLELRAAVRYCSRMELIPPDKEYRMTVSSGGTGPSPLNFNARDAASGAPSFSVFEFDPEGGLTSSAAMGAFERFCGLNRLAS